MMEHFTTSRDELTISTDNSLLDLDTIHDYLANRSYWAAGIPRETLEQSIRNSLCFGVYDGDRQIGFARAITDRATYAYLADVFILEEYRGRGIGKWLIGCILAHPELQGLRRFALRTRDAHELYRQFGFHEDKNPEKSMEKHTSDAYRTAQNTHPDC
jgi:GNAT superfamily N-acetyltransferase